MRFKVVGIGEILWDLLPDGRQMGGAPANFACHAAALGAEASLVSRVGCDEAGGELIRRLARFGVHTGGVEEDPAAPTGTVTVGIASDGQARFTIHEDVAWDRIVGETPGRLAMATANAVCFGTLAQRGRISHQSIPNLLKLVPAEALRIFDINLRQDFHTPDLIRESLGLANVLKVNEAELPRLVEMFGLQGDPPAQVAGLARRFGLRVVAYTRGEQGSLLYSEGRWSEHPGLPTNVVDTVGAGDSFTAAMALGLLAGWPLDLVHRRAAEVAAFVCSRPGATPELPEQLRAPFLTFRSPGPNPASRAEE